MGSTTVSAGREVNMTEELSASKAEILDSMTRLGHWLEKHDYRGYDTFDGLSARYVRPLTFETKFLRTVLQQGVRRFPVNLRPLLGIPASRSTKGMAFLAKGFIRLEEATGDDSWGSKAETALQWLVENESKGYSGACWGNHFDYQSRSFFLPAGVPTIVWTSLIGHAFIDAYDHFRKDSYLQVAVSACEHIVRDLDRLAEGDAFCFSYIPGSMNTVHNSNTLGASFLARTFARTGNESYKSLAEKAMSYTASHQRPDDSWYYGEPSNLHWVDNFHTAYVLDCFKYYQQATKDDQFEAKMNAGYRYWKKTFFTADGTPRYYDVKTLPIDIQCSSQAIDTLVLFSDQDPEALDLALLIARWTIKNMQDKSGYFYYRRYSRWLVNKTPTLHWGQATMFCALAGLYNRLGDV
jgi:polysaccharide biosynthesis protein VpsJ